MLAYRSFRRAHRVVSLALVFAVCTAITSPVKIKPGEPAPDFTLPDTKGELHTLSEYLDGETIVVLEWFNPECKFDIAHYEPPRCTMQTVYEKYKDRGVVWLAINSGSEASGTADPLLSESKRKIWDIEYPVLMDTDGEVGRLFRAVTTPHMYVIDRGGIFTYIGAIDDQPYVLNSDQPAKLNYVDNAITAILDGNDLEIKRIRAYGCAVKYEYR